MSSAMGKKYTNGKFESAAHCIICRNAMEQASRYPKWVSQKKSRSLPLLLQLVCMSIFFFGISVPVYGQTDSMAVQDDGAGYRIDQPGTITFTVGVKISGKVEKPQVVIFLPKEKTIYRKETLDRSYLESLREPLPYTPPAW